MKVKELIEELKKFDPELEVNQHEDCSLTEIYISEYDNTPYVQIETDCLCYYGP